MYNYKETTKSGYSDELINTYFLRPIAGLLVWGLYYTPVTPNQVTLASMVAGIVAAVYYGQGESQANVLAGILVTLKDLLDSADGQLARAKQLYSRRGRFLDSLSDLVSHIAIFVAIGWSLYRSSGSAWMPILSLTALVSLTLRVSYHVFYHTSYLHRMDQYHTNRLLEDVTEEDITGDPMALWLQKSFQFLYGWQDRLVARLDRWCKRGNEKEEFQKLWYEDRIGLRLSGFIGLGSELFLLTLCSLLDRVESYIYLNLFLMNGIGAGNIIYRRLYLSAQTGG